jgi:hypothetical protein
LAQRLFERAAVMSRPGFGSEASSRWLAAVRAWWVPAVLTLVALVLRTYNFSLLSWVPDGYEQLEATKRLLALDFPLSRIYSPGVAVVMAPFLLFLPRTLEGMQYVMIGSGVLLVPLAYLAVVRLTRDRVAATLLAIALTFAPAFVYQSRDPHYDPIVTLLLGACIALVPWLRGRGVLAFVAYGTLLAVLVNIRPVNLAAMPALLIYWGALELDARGWAGAARAVVAPKVILAGVTMVALTIAGIVFGGWWGEAARAPMTLEMFPAHLVTYYVATFSGLLGVFVAPLVLVGARLWWREQRPLLLALAFVIIVWPLVHALFFWTQTRYMLPSELCVWVLAAAGASDLRRRAGGGTLSKPVMLALKPAATMLALLLVVPSLLLVSGWDRIAARSEEGMLQDLRPFVARMDDRSTVITVMARGLVEANGRVEYVDLIDFSLDHGNGAAAKAAMADTVRKRLTSGRDVYYLYTHWEDGQDFEGDGRRGFIAYYEAVRDNFNLQLIERQEISDWRPHPWTLYKVTAR